MGRVLMIASQKGGVGKTTTALNLGYSLGRLGGNVLIVDTDPQGSLAVATNLRKRTGLGLVSVLRGECSAGDLVMATRIPGMHVAGSGVSDPTDVELLEEGARSGELAAILQAISEPYSYTVIDAPSGVGCMTTALLSSARSVVLPIQPRTLSLKTLPSFVKAVRHARITYNPRVRIEGILVTMYDPSNGTDQAALKEIQASLPEELIFRVMIPRDDLFEQATLRAIPAMLLPGGEAAARPYFELALELWERDRIREADDAEVAGLF